jgi:hypothetical protein
LIKDGQLPSALKMIEAALPKVDERDEEEIRLLKVKINMLTHEHEKVRAELVEMREKFPKGECIFESIRF